MLQKLHKAIIKQPVYSIIIICLLVRLVFIGLIYRHATLFPDSGDYLRLADILSHKSLNGYTGERTPGYPLLIILCNNNTAAVVALQLVLGIVTAIYCYRVLKVIGFTSTVAVYFTVFINCLVHTVFNEACILTESLTLFMLTAAVYHFLKVLFNGEKKSINIFLITLLTGYLTFIKPFYAFIPFIFCGLYVMHTFQLRKIINLLIVPTAFSLAVFFGWSFINKLNTGYFVSTTYYGLNLAQNCVYFAENVPDKYRTIGDIYAKHRDFAIRDNRDVAMSIWYAYDELTKTTGLSATDLNNLLGEYAKVAINHNKIGYIKQVALSWFNFWGTDIFWNYEDFHYPFFRKIFLLLWYITKWVVLALKAIFVLLLPYYIYRFFKTLRVDIQTVIYALVIATSVLQAIITFGTNSRYSFPVEWLILVSVAITVKEYLQNYHGHEQTMQHSL